MYISETGKNPKILRTELDGQNLAIIKETGSPSGLAIFEDALYFSGRNIDNQTSGDIVIQNYNTVDGSFEEIGTETQV